MGEHGMAVILGIGTATPDREVAMETYARNFGENFGLSETQIQFAERICKKAGISRKYLAIPFERYGAEALDAMPWLNTRLHWYEEEAVGLAEKAARAALTEWGGAAQHITHIIVYSTSGALSPGLDLRLIKRLGLNSSTKHFWVAFNGCHAGVMGIRTAAEIANGSGGATKVLVVWVEINSCQAQRPDASDPSNNIVVASIFGDGAAAAVIGTPASVIVSTAPLIATDNPGSASAVVGPASAVLGPTCAVVSSSPHHFTTERATNAPFKVPTISSMSAVVEPSALGLVDLATVPSPASALIDSATIVSSTSAIVSSTSAIVGAHSTPKEPSDALFEVHFCCSSFIDGMDSEEGIIARVHQAGLHAGLSKQVPNLIGQHVGKFAEMMLQSTQLSCDSVNWAVHPGGRAIVDAVQEGCNLQPHQLELSRRILDQYSNMGVPTILFILKLLHEEHKIFNKSLQWTFALAFGPGISIEGALLRLLPCTMKES